MDLVCRRHSWRHWIKSELGLPAVGLNDLNVNVYSDAEYGAGASGGTVVVGAGVETVISGAAIDVEVNVVADVGGCTVGCVGTNGGDGCSGVEVGSVVGEVVEVFAATGADDGTVGCVGTDGSVVCGTDGSVVCGGVVEVGVT